MAPRKPPPLNLTVDAPDDPLLLSSPDDSPTSPVSFSLADETDPTSSSDADPSADDISKDLQVLERLRRSVQKNLRLRPIKSASALPRLSPASVASPWREVPSPVSSTGSVYYTPLSGSLHSSPIRSLLGPRPIDPSSLATLLSNPRRPLLIDTRPPASYLASHIRSSINIAIPSLILKRYRKAGNSGFQSLDALRQFITTEYAKQTWDELMAPHSGKWNGNIVVYDEEMFDENPSLTAWALITLLAPLLPNGSVDYLKNGLSAARTHPRLRAHLVSDEPDSSDDHYDDMISSAKKSGGGTGGSGSAGLFQLDTLSAARSKIFPEIDREKPHHVQTPPPVMPTAISSSSTPSSSAPTVTEFDPSPPPSHLAFRRPAPPKRPSIPNLRRIDTKSAERLNVTLPKLHIRTPPTKAATLAVPQTLQVPNGSSSQPPRSPTHLNLMYSNHHSPTSTNRTNGLAPPSPNGQSEFNHHHYLPPPSPSFFSTSFSSSPTHSGPATPRTPRTPTTPMPLPSPSTARPGGSDTAPPSTEETFPAFTISAILPNFLYLGPELTTEEHVKELKTLGVKRIINIAAECDDDHGLQLRENFDRYFHIPMRDIVEEENITRGVREACDILDDARLHSAPTYVHCKAGKSRSVTAVIAYLIHANHWTLSRAYSFVLERRKGISPNIGFVSELMTFEEQELGGKSVGVVQPSSSSSSGGADGDHQDEQYHYHDAHGGYGGPASRRPMHLRESLPPAFTTTQSSESFLPGPMSAGGISSARVGDSGQEMEIKDATGRYRHARRAPVDENTLQPMRRVSKAGLESSVNG